MPVPIRKKLKGEGKQRNNFILICKTGPKTDSATQQLLEHVPCSVQVFKVLISFCNTLALTLPTAATKGLRKWIVFGLEARKGRKWKQRPFVGKGKERRKGRGWGAAPISSAPDPSGRPRGFLQGTSRGRCSSVALRRPGGTTCPTAGHSPER